MARDPLTRAHAVFLQAEAAKRGDYSFPYLADAEWAQSEAEPVEQTEPLWESALVVAIFFLIVAVMVSL